MTRPRPATVAATEYHRFATEAQLMNAIANNARQLGYLVYHAKVSIGSRPGFPDLIIVGFGAMFAIETKGPRGVISDEQKQWIEELQRAGVSARFAYSTIDSDFDEIMNDLQDAYEADFRRSCNGRRG
jgi:hypothetical protein